MAGMKVKVDFDLCESNAVCMGPRPEVFEVRDDDFLYILDEHPPEALRPKVEEAVRGDLPARRPRVIRRPSRYADPRQDPAEPGPRPIAVGRRLGSRDPQRHSALDR